MTKTSHEFYIEFNGILLIGNGRIQHANYCCIISLIGKYLHVRGGIIAYYLSLARLLLDRVYPNYPSHFFSYKNIDLPL